MNLTGTKTLLSAKIYLLGKIVEYLPWDENFMPLFFPNSILCYLEQLWCTIGSLSESGEKTSECSPPFLLFFFLCENTTKLNDNP